MKERERERDRERRGNWIGGEGRRLSNKIKFRSVYR